MKRKTQPTPRLRGYSGGVRRALDRQADVLSEHERKIAAHTAAQTWTNIASIAMSIVTAVVLGWIAWGQWQSSKREVDLEYARSANQFTAKVIYKDQSGDETSPSYLILNGMPYRLELRRLRGDNNLIGTEVTQKFKIGKGLLDQNACYLAVANWFEASAEDPTEIDLNKDLSEIYRIEGWPDRQGRTYDIRPLHTEVRVSYYDLFGKAKIDTLEVFGRKFEPVNEESEKDSQFLKVTISEDRRFSGPLSVNEVPESCRPFVTTQEEELVSLKQKLEQVGSPQLD